MNRRKYTVSKDSKSGMWYAHMEGFSYIPVGGSFSVKRSEATEYAKMYNCLQNRVEQIETSRHEQFVREMELET